MQNYGRTSVHELVGDFIVPRSLAPMDRRLPPLAGIRVEVGLPEGVAPHTSEPAYARAIVHLLRLARALDLPGASIQRLVYVGDTRLNDGTVFANVCRAGGRPGLAIIAAERHEPARIETSAQEEGALNLANRWVALAAFTASATSGSYRWTSTRQ